jgi:hypothetical protein
MMDLRLVTTEDNIRCWVIPAYDNPVVLYCTAIHIVARIGLDIRDSCDSASSFRRGNVLVIMALWIEMIRRFFDGDIDLDSRLDCEVDTDGCLGRSERDLVTGVLTDEPVTPKRALN